VFEMARPKSSFGMIWIPALTEENQ
jgi:hypothetical protein